jgi:hypothetical protein
MIVFQDNLRKKEFITRRSPEIITHESQIPVNLSLPDKILA